MSEMPAKGGPTKPQRKAAREQKRAQRRARVWHLFMRGVPMSTIAAIVDCAPQTVKKDIDEVTQELKDLEPLHASDTRERAIDDRRHLKNLSLEASAEAEAKDRGPLLGEARKNQTGIEDLEGLHPKDAAPAAQASVFVFPLGDGAQPQLGELSDEELARAQEKIAADLAALPKPADDAEPPAEYTPVEEPVPAEDASGAEPDPESA